MDYEQAVMKAMQKIIRVGRVHSYDPTTRMARVKFENLGGIISTPIKVVSRPRHVVHEQKILEGDRTADKALQYDKSNVLTTEKHYHTAYVTDWNPKINDQVLCIYYPDGGGDGYVIGEV